MFNDIRHGLRILYQNPGFTCVAVLILALGIGGNSAMFTLVNALVLRPIEAERPTELVGCYSKSKKPDGFYRSFSYPNYQYIRVKNTVFANLMAHVVVMTGLSEGERTRRTFSALVSANYFSTFGVKMAKGRDFLSSEEKPGQDSPVVIASYQYWKKTDFDPGLLGRALRINGRSFTVVGIAPEGFTGTAALFAPEFWLPLGVYDSVINDFMNEQKRPLKDRNHHCLMLVGRLKTGMEMKTAEAELANLADQLEIAYPAENKDYTFILSQLPRLSINTTPHNDRSELTMVSVLLLSLSGMVLLIACLNLANMSLVRNTARRKEIAIRIALGGSRWRILRQLLTEGLILSLLGGAAGLVLAYWTIDLLISSMAPHISFLNIVFQTRPDPVVFTATFGFCILATVLFGLGPAWKLARADVVTQLKEQTGEARRQHHLWRGLTLRNLMVVAQMVLSLTLLTAAGLMLRSAFQAAKADPGFRFDRILLAEIDPSLAGYDEARGQQLYQTIVARLKALPGVQSVSLANVVPFGIFSEGREVQKAASSSTTNSLAKDASHYVGLNVIGTDYFKTLGLPLLRGREFNRLEVETKTSARVAIIDEPLARLLWPNQDALGKRIQFKEKQTDQSPEVMDVVGVVPGVKNELSDKEPRPHIYVPFGQLYRSSMNIHIKTAQGESQAESAMLKAVRQALLAIDEHLPLLSMNTMREFHHEGLLMWFVNTSARLFTTFGILALFLAVVGLYGVKAYIVSRRTREIGIRMALGATTDRVLWLVLKEGMLLTVIGLSIGLIASFAIGQLLSNQLYGIKATDPLTFIVSPFCLALSALLACYIPARRAAKVEPMTALRYE